MQCWRQEISSRCLATLLARWNGRPVNITEIAGFLRVSRPTASARIRELVRDGRVRLLAFFGPGGKPLLFVRHLYGPGSECFRSYCTEAVIERIKALFPSACFFWWKTGTVRRVDLLVVLGQSRIGFCFGDTRSRQKKDWHALRVCVRRGLIQRGFFLYRGCGAFHAAPMVIGVPLNAFLAETGDWILRRRTLWDLNRCAGPSSGSRRALAPPGLSARR